MQKLLLTILFVVVFISVLPAQSDVADKKVWTLRECVDYAVTHNLTLQRSTYGVESSEIAKLQALMAMFPNLNASGNYGYNWGRSIDPATNLFVEQRIKSINLNVSSSLLLWNGFRLFYAYKQSDVDLDAANEDLIKARNDVILNVITIYLNVVFNQELYNNADAQLSSTRQQLERTRRLSDAGSVPRSDVLNLDAQLATNEVNLIQRENAVNLSLLQLKQALQLPASTPMEVQVPEIDIDGNLNLDKTSEEIFEIAVMAMPETKSARLKQESAVYGLKSARGNLYPRLSLGGSISTIYSDARQTFIPEGAPTYTNTTDRIGYLPSTNEPIYATDIDVPGSFEVVPYNTQFRDNLGRNVGLTLQIPIFNGLSARSGVQRAVINRELSNISYKETENQLRQSVETAYNDAVASSKTYAATQKQVQARSEAFRMMKQRFEFGSANFVEYQISENDLFQAQSDLLRAKYDFIFRVKILDFYQGKPLEF